MNNTDFHTNLHRALTLDTLIQKGFHRFLNYVDDNPNVDMNILAEIWEDAIANGKEWEKIKTEILNGEPNCDSLVSAYFKLSMREEAERIGILIEKTKIPIAEGRPPHVNDKIRFMLTYSPENYHNHDTLRLAKREGVGLE